jgi:hypothetical protein
MIEINTRWGDSRRPRIAAVARLAAAGAAAMLLTGTIWAQEGGFLERRLEAVKQKVAANRQALQHYTWTETSQVSLNGEVKSTRESSCRSGPDGKPQCTATGAPPQQPDEKGIRGRIVERRKEELTDYMQQVKGVIGLYVPPEAARMEAARKAGNVSLSLPGGGEAALVFKNYAQPGDSMSLDFAMATKKMTALSVNTYLGDPSSPVTMTVDFASLPDGTNYPARTVVNAAAKGIQVTTTNSNYVKIQ